MTIHDRITFTATAACGAYFLARALPLLLADLTNAVLNLGRMGW